MCPGAGAFARLKLLGLGLLLAHQWGCHGLWAGAFARPTLLAGWGFGSPRVCDLHLDVTRAWDPHGVGFPLGWG